MWIRIVRIAWKMNVTYDSIHGYREHPYVLDFMKDKDKQQIIKDAGRRTME